MGDELLCSAFAWEFHRRYGRPIVLMCRQPELFEGNATVKKVLPADRDAVGTFARWNLDMRVLCEWQPNHDNDRQVSPARHIIVENLKAGGITGSIEIRPRFFLSKSELAEGTFAENQVAIQSSGRAAVYFMPNKEWIEGRHAQLTKALGQCYSFVQVGTVQDPPIAGALDLRGKTSLRQLAAILARSRFFVGQVGFLMHLARAVDTRAVIIYGGREHPAQSGYVCNENLYTPIPCAPCWQRARCDFGHECMTKIGVQDVMAAITRLEHRLSTPLETDSAMI